MLVEFEESIKQQHKIKLLLLNAGDWFMAPESDYKSLETTVHRLRVDKAFSARRYSLRRSEGKVKAKRKPDAKKHD